MKCEVKALICHLQSLSLVTLRVMIAIFLHLALSRLVTLGYTD